MNLKRGLFLVPLCWCSFCQADDTGNNLEFTGTIVAQTCDVELSSLSQSIDLGQFSVEDFPSTGTTTKFKPFNINLKNCSRGITGTKIWFTGTADSNDPSLLALTDTGMGSENMLASGVGVELLDEDQDDVSMNNSDSVVYPLKAGRNTLSFYIRYKSTQPTVTSGNATAVMYFDLQYE
ncbi:fimbrial protein BcfE [Klebsiella sp. RHBSTW-00484]|uniref:fimbrial protein BcfE n=1 Tax=unclassified Klebsiella TaxID=2608929 RepID=UPI0015E4FD61|nr:MULTISPECIES: fimbrial protein BcfE [unclassified Klebsiella]MBA7843401.1 fimbrial protein BcfE [Klebsiella sp. RHBSTW-00465]QLO38767.1 fimbrial protein BcfE [Klebsiella sp. RHBSTW-00484]QLT78287.1 fimbrial protein BcfE [Klebsiella sp. RHBSTW-00464]